MLRHCRVCGAEYKTCYSCEKERSWRTLTDTADHYYILGVLMEYQSSHDARKAYDALCKRGVDLRETEGYIPSVRKLLEEINASVAGKSRAKKLVSKPKLSSTEESKEAQASNNENGDAEDR